MDLEPVHRAHQVEMPIHQKNTACQVSLTEDGDNDGFLVTENTVTLTRLNSHERISIDRLSIVNTDVDDPTRSHHSLHQKATTCSQQLLNRNSFGSQQEIRFWKMAADMIADQPIKS